MYRVACSVVPSLALVIYMSFTSKPIHGMVWHDAVPITTVNAEPRQLVSVPETGHLGLRPTDVPIAKDASVSQVVTGLTFRWW